MVVDMGLTAHLGQASGQRHRVNEPSELGRPALWRYQVARPTVEWTSALAQGVELVIGERARLFLQHDRDALANRIGEPGRLADQLLRRRVVNQRGLGARTNQKLEQPPVDALGRGCCRPARWL